MTKKEHLQKNLQTLFTGRIAAFEFICLYLDYCHMVDDLVDEDKNIERINDTVSQASRVFNCSYWKQYGNSLLLVDRLIHNKYFDCVTWEHSEEQWKNEHARVLNHCGYDMLFAVILIEFGEGKLNELSLDYRNFAHEDNNDYAMLHSKVPNVSSPIRDNDCVSNNV